MNLDKKIEQLFNQVNRVRSGPQQYANHCRELQSHYEGKVFRGRYKTREGATAVQDLMYDLQNRQNSDHALKWSFGLHMIADEKARILGENGLITTQGTDHHKILPQRARQYAVCRGRVSQVCDFGAQCSQDVIESILIDDGLGSRKRRKTVLDPVYKYIGIGSWTHTEFGTVTVLVLGQSVTSLVAPGQEGHYVKRAALEQGGTKTMTIQQQKINQGDRLVSTQRAYSLVNKILMPSRGPSNF